jgi:AcrR family transcriptional regulator
MSKIRQQQYSEEVRNRIIDISQRIISEEGLEALSIRRVASEMDYSPGIIYYYFNNKDELLSCAVRDGYRRILSSVKIPKPDLPPDEKLRESFKNFVDAVMQTPNAYKSFASSFASGLFQELATPNDNGYSSSPTYSWIVSYINEGNKAGLFACDDPILTASVFWCAGYGLLFRLLIDPAILPEQRDTLIQHQFDVLLNGIYA